MVYWDDLGFTTAYTVDPEPEYPGDGAWGMIARGVNGEDPGAPIAVIRPTDLKPWLLTARVPTVGELYGSPDPHQICIARRFEQPVMLDVRDPGRQDSVDIGAIHVAAAVDEGLILFADWDSVTAWDGRDIRWSTDPIVQYDLHFRRTGHGRIVCVGTDFESTKRFEVTLDAATGAIVANREIVPRSTT
jgi:hypothetical protein